MKRFLITVAAALALVSGFSFAVNEAQAQPSRWQCEMSNSSFETLLMSIKGNSFDDGRLNILSSAMLSNRVSSAQAQSLMKSLTFDKNRLEAARMMAGRLCDPQNNYLLYDALTFDSDKDTLRGILASAPQVPPAPVRPVPPAPVRPVPPQHTYHPPVPQPAYHHPVPQPMPGRPAPHPAPAPAYHHGHHPGSHGYACGLTNDVYSYLSSSIRNEPHDSNKTDIIRRVMVGKTITAEQAKSIMKLYTFDDDRLEAAKILLPVMCDMNNAYILYDTMTFDSEKEALGDLIRRYSH